MEFLLERGADVDEAGIHDPWDRRHDEIVGRVLHQAIRIVSASKLTLEVLQIWHGTRKTDFILKESSPYLRQNIFMPLSSSCLVSFDRKSRFSLAESHQNLRKCKEKELPPVGNWNQLSIYDFYYAFYNAKILRNKDHNSRRTRKTPMTMQTN